MLVISKKTVKKIEKLIDIEYKYGTEKTSKCCVFRNERRELVINKVKRTIEYTYSDGHIYKGGYGDMPIEWLIPIGTLLEGDN